jgi:chromatin modification-related protein VID21
MLKTLVREYHYNWGLISQCLALEGMWHSGSERRSPWECFERWISLEQVPQEFLKSPFFKPIQQRLDVAARVNGLYGNVSNSAGASGVKPRRGTAPMRVEKRRASKYFTMIESMRKLAKKRETSVNKQQTNKSNHSFHYFSILSPFRFPLYFLVD